LASVKVVLLTLLVGQAFKVVHRFKTHIHSFFSLS
jgi:hypothetical protein